MLESKITESRALVVVPPSYFFEVPGFEDNRLSLGYDGQQRCNEMAKDLINHKARTFLRHFPILGSYLNNNFDKLLNTFKKNCLRAVANPNPQLTSSSQAFWSTTPFQIMGAMQVLGNGIAEAGRQFTDDAKSMGAQVAGAAVLVGLTAVAVYQLRFGNTAPLQRLVEAL